MAPPGAREMVQSNLSRSKAGVLRGMHYQREQVDYWVVIEGKAFVAQRAMRWLTLWWLQERHSWILGTVALLVAALAILVIMTTAGAVTGTPLTTINATIDANNNITVSRT